MNLTMLAAAYRRDRAEIDAQHPPRAETRVCRYCGAFRQVWAGSKFEGHATCVVSPAFMRQVADTLEGDARITFLDVALALDVSSAIVRAWWKKVKG